MVATEIGYLSIRTTFDKSERGGEGKVNTLAGGVADPGTRFADRPVTDTGIQIILV